MLSENLLVGSVFIVVYLLIASYSRFKTRFVWGGVIFLFLFGMIDFSDAFHFVNWNVMGIYLGMLIMSYLLTYSDMPAHLAVLFVRRSKNVGMAIVWMCALSGFISIFIDNVTTVFIVAPIAFSISRRMNTSPVPFIISVAIASNLQGAATLIGDPPSMLLAGFLKMTFNDFFFMQSKPGMFFAVQLGAIASLGVIYLMFKRLRRHVDTVRYIPVVSNTPTVLLMLLIALLAVSSSLDPGFTYLAGLICVIFGLVGLIWFVLLQGEPAKKLVENIDWETPIFLAGVFIIVGALVKTNITSTIGDLIAKSSGNSLFIAFNVVVWFSVIFSAFIDNIPYIITMLPVVSGVAEGLGAPPYVLMFGLVLGASVGGNITPVGASANVVAWGMLKKKGYDVSFWQFMKIGLPFTVVGVLASSVFIWLVWA